MTKPQNCQTASGDLEHGNQGDLNAKARAYENAIIDCD